MVTDNFTATDRYGAGVDSAGVWFKPGDIVINENASEDNPLRVVMITAVRSRCEGINPGRYYEVSNFRGDGALISVTVNHLVKLDDYPLLDGPREALDRVRAALAEAKALIADPEPSHD